MKVIFWTSQGFGGSYQRHLLVPTMLVSLAAALSGCGGGGGSAVFVLPSVAELTATCNSMKGKTFGAVTVTDTKRIEANPAMNSSGFCQVLATQSPFLDIEVDVPDNWSGRLWHQGGAGFDGTIPTATTKNSVGAITAVSPALAQKAAIYAASNGGNRASVPAQAGPGVWAGGTADGNTSADDYAYAAIGKTIGFAKSVTKAFFATAPTRSYFNGCSNGGRNAYIAAQRWPDEYDGIVSGCETMDMGGQTTAWLNVGSRAGTPAALTSAQYTAAFGAAVSACDGLDGVVDGVIANPQACTYDPAALQCGAATANSDPAICLSAAQVSTLHSLLSDIRLSDGTLAYTKYSWGDFSGFGAAFGALGGAYAMLATNDPTWMTPVKQATFNLDTDYYAISTGLMRRGLDNDKVGIASFVASGKKLISWHDGSDNLLSGNDHARNYATMTSIAKSMGLSDPTTNTRFFIVPGGSHAQGASLLEVDWASAIIDWVENDNAPAQLQYAFTQNSVARTIPVCQYPKYPKYNGSGNVNSAASFTCS
jgi:hypothetical protein